MQRFIFLNRFFFPDLSASSQILSDLAFDLAKAGREVHVITSCQLYNDQHAMLAREEEICRVKVHRIGGTRFGRRQLVGRGIDYLSYLVASHAAVLKLANFHDVIIAKTDPPLLSIVALHAANRKGAYLVNWLQDLYPEVAVELGVRLLDGPIGHTIRYLRDRSLKQAATNVTVGDRMAAKVRASCGDATRVDVIPNWSNDEEICPVAQNDNPLRKAWQLTDKFVVGYSGNLGRAHEFDTILRAAELLRSRPQVIFLFIGGGHSFETLAQSVKRQKLDHMFRFLPYQDRTQLKNSLGVPDVHLLSLRPEVEGLIVPSKFYGIAAAGRPILAIAAKDGEFAPVIERHHCGFVIEPGQTDILAKTILELSNDPVQCASMGARARQMLETNYSRQQAFQRWHATLDRLDYFQPHFPRKD